MTIARTKSATDGDHAQSARVNAARADPSVITVAAPIFKDVATFALSELEIPPTGVEATPLQLVLDEPPAKDDPRVLGREYLP